jgi:hypothetical protein
VKEELKRKWHEKVCSGDELRLCTSCGCTAYNGYGNKTDTNVGEATSGKAPPHLAAGLLLYTTFLETT